MGDAKLRDLERKVERDGSLEARVELLQGRLRAGSLGHDWLEIAARLGDAPARKVLGRFVKVEGPLRTFKLLRIAHEPAIRISLRVAESHLEDWQRDQPGQEPPEQIGSAFLAVRGWLEEPGDEAQRRACAEAVKNLEAVDAALVTEADELQNAWEAHYEAQRQHRYTSTFSQEELLQNQIDMDASQTRRTQVRQRRQLVEATALPAHCVLAKTSADAARLLEDGPWDVERRVGGAKALRALLAPWALSPARANTPAPLDWITPPDQAEQQLAAPAPAAPEPIVDPAFEASLKDKDVKKRATALRKLLKAKQLDKDLVALAAQFGDPAAWLVAKPAGVPDLEPPSLDREVAGARMNVRLMTIVARFAKALPKDEVRRIKFLQRMRDPDGGGNEVGPAWPEWARHLIARLGLALGEAMLSIYEEANPDQELPRQALDAARAFHLRPQSEPEPVTELAKATLKLAGRRSRRPDRVKSAVRVVGWTVELVVRAHQKARQPRLHYANREVLREAFIAGLEPQDLWDLLRETSIRWALGEDDLGLSARPYSPKESFAAGETIQHSKFGEGKVVAVRGKKLEAEFPDGRKTLIHAG